MKKKILLIFLALISVFALTFGLSACDTLQGGLFGGDTEQNEDDNSSDIGNNSETEDNKGDVSDSDSETEDKGHVHDWGEWELTTPATCSTQGEETRTCKLDSAHKETRKTAINPTAHTYGVLNQEQPATCSEKGSIAHYHCSCGKYFNEEKEEISEAQLEIAIDPTAHTYGVDNLCSGCNKKWNHTENLEYQLNSDKQSYSVTGTGSATDTEIVIPYGYNSLPVTSIGERAFYWCTSLKSITIPESVTSIGAWAFYNCTTLTSITIPDSVTSIGAWAFYNCSSLASITLGSGVTSIGNGAFGGCTSLESITIPDSVTSIDGGAFRYCTSLESITVDLNNKNYSIQDGILYNKNKTILIQCPGAKTSVNIPDSVTSIGWGAFFGCTNLESITIPNSVTSIGGYAFCECMSLESVTISPSVNYIGTCAFWDCNSLSGVYITDLKAWCNIEYGYNNGDPLTNPLQYAHNLYLNNELITELNIPQGVAVIKKYVFSGFGGTSVIIPNSVTSIGDGAFYECTSLTSITIPDSVTTIGWWAFYKCTSLNSVSIGKSVTTIGGSAFFGCESLKEVTFKNTTGWKISQNSNMSNAQDITVTDATQNAKFLRDTYGYYWQRYDN